MTTRREKSAVFIQDALAKSLIPRNQVANISGLTNTYIRDLEQGNITNVSREKLLKFSTAVGLDLPSIDQMLKLFDRAGLDAEDIPIFIENARKQKASSILHTARDFFGYELSILATESLAGPKILSTNHPTVVLQPCELRRCFMGEDPTDHPIYKDLRRAIGRERRANLVAQLAHHDMHHYISKRALEAYVLGCKDGWERGWRARHLLNIRDFILAYPRFKYRLTRAEIGFNCLLKYAGPEDITDRSPERIFFYTHDMSLLQGQFHGQIIGFYTGNPVILEQFKKDVDIVRSRVVEKYADPGVLAGFLEALVDRAGGAH